MRNHRLQCWTRIQDIQNRYMRSVFDLALTGSSEKERKEEEKNSNRWLSPIQNTSNLLEMCEGYTHSFPLIHFVCIKKKYVYE